MVLLCKQLVETQDGLWDKILPTLISASIVVLLFIVGRILDSTIKSKEIRRNWYQKVIIDPNLSLVANFYPKVLAQAKKSINYLVSIVSGPHDIYLVEKVKEIEKFKVIKRKFESEFILLVQTNYPEIANDLSVHLRDIEDCLTAILDKNDLTTNDYDDLESKIISKKYCIYGILYKPLIFKRPKFISIIKGMFKRK